MSLQSLSFSSLLVHGTSRPPDKLLSTSSPQSKPPSRYPSPGLGQGSSATEPRRPLACDSCHRKKIKCDDERPCNWCRHHNLPCTFTRPRRYRRDQGHHVKKSNNNADWSKSEDQLLQRMERLERAVMENVHQKKHDANASTSASPDAALDTNLLSSSPSNVSLNGRIQLAEHNLGAVNYFSGIPFFSPEGQEWVRSRTGETLALDDNFSNAAPWLTYRETASEQLASRHNLPRRAVLEQYLNLYFSSFLHRIFPFVDKTLFEQTLDAVYQDSASATSRACVFSFLAFMSDFRNHNNAQLPEINGKGMESEAERLISILFREPVTVDGLQAVLQLAGYHMCTANLGTVDMFLSLATRMVFALGGNMPSTCPSPHVRTLFWFSYVIDKDLSLRTGRPPLLSDEQCDLTLPDEYVQRMRNLSSSSASDELLDQFPGDLRLSMIKSKTYNGLYSAKALKKDDSELVRTILELGRELDDWRDSFPAEYRSVFKGGINDDRHASMRWVLLTLEYYHCTCIIHQASSRISGWNGMDHNMEGVSSSLERCVEASRSSLMHLRASHDSLPDGCFWVVIFYPLCALLTLFRNTLVNPLHDRSRQDIDLMDDAAKILRNIPASRYSPEEIAHSNTLNQFLKELVRLSRRAVDRAREQ